jgi:hypothetical protein
MALAKRTRESEGFLAIVGPGSTSGSEKVIRDFRHRAHYNDGFL